MDSMKRILQREQHTLGGPGETCRLCNFSRKATLSPADKQARASSWLHFLAVGISLVSAELKISVSSMHNVEALQRLVQCLNVHQSVLLCAVEMGNAAPCAKCSSDAKNRTFPCMSRNPSLKMAFSSTKNVPFPN